MTYRQQLLKAAYPFLMWFAKVSGKNTLGLSAKSVAAPISFYLLKDTLINGGVFDFAQLKNKKVLLVNTASNCGYTNQYENLEKLYQRFKDKLVIIGFPSNDFKEQEKSDNAAIAEFCKLNFGVSFPLMQKSVVKRGSEQNKVFDWLTDAGKNGWNAQEPTWNFCKYLIDENGNLSGFWPSVTDPLDDQIINAIK